MIDISVFFVATWKDTCFLRETSLFLWLGTFSYISYLCRNKPLRLARQGNRFSPQNWCLWSQIAHVLHVAFWFLNLSFSTNLFMFMSSEIPFAVSSSFWAGYSSNSPNQVPIFYGCLTFTFGHVFFFHFLFLPGFCGNSWNLCSTILESIVFHQYFSQHFFRGGCKTLKIYTAGLPTFFFGWIVPRFYGHRSWSN